MLTINRGEVLTLPLKRRKLVVDLAPDMAEQLLPSEVKPNVGLVTITGELKVKDNKLKIEVKPKLIERKYFNNLFTFIFWLINSLWTKENNRVMFAAFEK